MLRFFLVHFNSRKEVTKQLLPEVVNPTLSEFHLIGFELKRKMAAYF